MLTQENMALIHKAIPLYTDKVRLESDIISVMVDSSEELKKRSNQKLSVLKVIYQKTNIAFENHKNPDFDGKERVVFVAMMGFLSKELESRQMISIAGQDNSDADVFNSKLNQRINEIKVLLSEMKKEKIL